MESQLLNHSDLLKALLTNNLYEKAIQQANRKYKIKHYRIEKLKPSGIKTLLKKNLQKEKLSTLQENNYAWAEGQLKIFVWFLVGYVHIKKIDISDITESDFQFFSEIFDGYSIDFLYYQAKFLLRSTEKVAWSEKEAKLLNSIIKAKFQQKNWNTVAYELYLLSDKTVFRTPKQCRERWLNHEDPNKIHSQWTILEDIELLRFVKSLGKKWSLISRSMKSTRTEHMVKNRFTSLMKKASKNQKHSTQKQLIEQILKSKKNQKIQKENDPTPLIQLQNSQILNINTESTIEPELNIELQQIEMTQEDLNKKEKELQFFFPCNLITEQASQMEQQPLFVEDDELINYFQVDNQAQKELFMSWFD